MDRTVLVWDLGNTLIHADAWTFVQEIGLTDFLAYAILDWKNPFKIYEDAFALLRRLDTQKSHPGATARGIPLPELICTWLAGKIDPAEISATIESCIERLAREGYFKSSRQEQLTRRTVEVIFNPTLFAQCMKPIKKGIQLLKECAVQTNPDGSARNQLYILSNWDAYSFEQMIPSSALSELFGYFKPENIMISGRVGCLKPQPLIYETFLDQFNLTPENCIMIDDQEENLISAQELGMTGLLLEQRNYSELAQRLETLHIIRRSS
jgi:putative hydrolase of the HAD superfamily